MAGPLAGKVALVTGASRGIGAAIAERLSADGATVAVTYNSSPAKANEVVAAIQSNGGKAIAIQADAADDKAIRSAVDRVAADLGRLDILVNNAGIAQMGDIDTMTMEQFDRLLAVNVRGVFAATQAASRHLPEGGRVINIGSCTAHRMPFVGGGPYAMTKAAVAALTRGLSRDFAARGITVNNVEPGPVDTEMNPQDGPNGSTMLSMIPIGRYGHVNDIASMVAYLAGPESSYITGASFAVDGGVNT